MAELLSYEEIWAASLAIDEILLYLHYSIWLEIEYDGRPEDTQIEILRGPAQEFEKEITAHLETNYEDYVIKDLRCPRCGGRRWDPALTSCPNRIFPTESPLAPFEQCGAALELVRYDPGEAFVREKAELSVMGRGSFVGKRSLVGKRVTWRILNRTWTPPDMEMHLTIRELRDHLRAEMTEQVDRVDSKVSLRDPARLLGRRDLYPRGATVDARYSDYLDTRDKLISCYHWLDGQTVNHPVFVDAGEQARGIHVFSPPILLPRKGDVSDMPVWDSDRRELQLHGRVCKAFRKSRAPNQTRILEAFQEDHWARRIDDPLPGGQDVASRRLRETIRGLNNGLKHITFRADGTGTGIIWERRGRKSVHRPR